MKQSNKDYEQRLDQLRQQFHQQTSTPKVETLKRLLVLEQVTLNNIVESKLGEIVEQQTSSEPIALGVQLFVRISRQFPALPPFVVVDVVLALGNLYSVQDDFAEVLADLKLI